MLAPVEVSLDDDSDILELFPQPEHDIDRALCVGAPLHVHANKILQEARAVRDLAEVLVTEFVIDVEAELGELDRDIAVYPLGTEGVEHCEDFGSRLARVLLRLRVFSKQVQGSAYSVALGFADCADSILQSLSRNKAPRRVAEELEAQHEVFEAFVVGQEEQEGAHS